MSLENAIAEIKAIIEGAVSGIVDTPQEGEVSLLSASRGRFENCYCVRMDAGPRPLPELVLDARRYRVPVRVEIGIAVTKERLDAQVLITERAALIDAALLWPGTFNNFNLVPPLPDRWFLSEKERRIVLSAVYHICYGVA